MTVRELIRKSMLLTGVLSSGENMSADEGTDGLSSLNELLESWSTEGLLIYTVARESFSFVAGTASYTMGSGGTFNTTKPMLIEQVGVIDSSTEYPCDIINVQRFSEIPSKSSQSQIPLQVYVSEQATTKTLTFYPVPSTTNQAVIYSRKPFTAFSTLSESISIPQGYQRALRYNLGCELAIEYGKQIEPRIEQEANKLKAQLMRQNLKGILLKSDAAQMTGIRKRYNIFTGE